MHFPKRFPFVASYLLIIALFTIVAYNLSDTTADLCRSNNANSEHINHFIDTLVETTKDFGRGTQAEKDARIAEYKNSKVAIVEC